MNDERYKILLIEDDKLDQMAFTRMMKDRELPYDCTIAGSVSEARGILDSRDFDVVICDYALGDGTAFDILNTVRNIPIILVTGVGNEELVTKAWKAGACDYLIKDLDQSYLKTVPITIENAVKHSKMEEILNQKKKNLEAIFDAAPIGMVLVNENMIVRRVNDAVRQMVGKDYLEIINRRLGEALGCINSTYDEQGCGSAQACKDCSFRKTIQKALDSQQSLHGVEIRPVFEFGGKKISPWLHISAEPTTIDKSRHIVIAVNDVSEQKEAERKLRLAEERYRTIFENSAVAITMVDEQKRLISWNKFTENLLGMSKEDLYLRPVKSLYPPQEWEKIRNYDVRQKGMQHHLETKIIKNDGEVIDINISLSVLQDSDQKTTGSIGVFRDITDRKKAEEKLKETMEIKSQFISTVSHELRTPLTCIKNAITNIVDGALGEINEKQRDFLNIAGRNADKLVKLISDVLDFQKLEAGRMQLNIEENDITKVATEAYETTLFSAKKKDVDFSLDLENNLPRAKFDYDGISRVLLNLISNAIKFTPEQGRVCLSVKKQNEQFLIRVRDTGMGIPKKNLLKIFDRFYCVHRPGKQIPGTGLGLAIVNKIVMGHGGRIEVESELDQGSTFTVFLPLEPKLTPTVSESENNEVLEKAVFSD